MNKVVKYHKNVVYLNRMKKRTGFTLIELLVVIAIMGVLTMITVSQFSTARKKARDVSRKTDLSSVSKALYMYFADYGIFPLDNDPSTGINSKWGGEFTDNGYIYMKTLPKESQINWSPYCYVVSPDRKSFAIFTRLENTSDSDCKSPGYTHCSGNPYCYSVTSENANVSDFGGLNP